MLPVARATACGPPCSAAPSSTRSTLRSSAVTPRTIGAITSARWRIGGNVISIAVMKATKPPTVWPPAALCHSATTITADIAHAAMICVSGVIAADAVTFFSTRRRSALLSCSKRFACVCAGAVQANDPPGQHVFLDHVGEVVVGALAFLGQALHAPADGAHHPGDGGEQQADEQGERPVQIQQVNEQRGQRQRVAHQREHRRHQLRGRALHLVDQHVGQAAGRMAGEQRRLGAQQVVEQTHAQRLHALVGGPGEGVLRCKPGQAPKREETDDRHRHDPHRDSSADETLVEQRLHHRRQGRLGNCC